MRGWASHELNCGLWRRLLLGMVIFGTSIRILVLFGAAADLSGGSETTTTPIKHVIVVIGENRSFDHVYGTYRPKNGNSVLNLLSEGIVTQDGSPGPRVAQARQYSTSPQTNYFISVAAKQKLPYKTLPAPTLGGSTTGGAPNKAGIESPPFTPWALAAWRFAFLILQRGSLEPSLEPEDFVLLTTGATGAAGTTGPDPRIANSAALANGPFRLTGPDLPYDSYTGDTEHEFFQMWQQSDCNMANASKHNPTGCLHDLYPFVATTYAGPTADEAGGTSMAFYDIGDGDAPFLKRLADQYTINDNFHAPAQGGTGLQLSSSEPRMTYFGATARATRAHLPPARLPIPIPRPEPITNTLSMGSTANAPTQTRHPGWPRSWITSKPCLTQ
jgi:phospholipase C